MNTCILAHWFTSGNVLIIKGRGYEADHLIVLAMIMISGCAPTRTLTNPDNQEVKKQIPLDLPSLLSKNLKHENEQRPRVLGHE